MGTCETHDVTVLRNAIRQLCPPVTMGDHVIPIHTCKRSLPYMGMPRMASTTPLCTVKPIFYHKTCSRWLPNANKINTNNMKSTRQSRSQKPTSRTLHELHSTGLHWGSHLCVCGGGGGGGVRAGCVRICIGS